MSDCIKQITEEMRSWADDLYQGGVAVHNWADRIDALTSPEAEADAELGRYIRMTADQRRNGLSDHAFWLRVDSALERRAAIAAAPKLAGGSE